MTHDLFTRETRERESFSRVLRPLSGSRRFHPLFIFLRFSSSSSPLLDGATSFVHLRRTVTPLPRALLLFHSFLTHYIYIIVMLAGFCAFSVKLILYRNKKNVLINLKMLILDGRRTSVHGQLILKKKRVYM